MIEVRSRRRGFTTLSWCLAGLCAAASTAFGQTRPSNHDPDSFINQQRITEQRIREQLSTEGVAGRDMLFDWGGWYSSYLFIFDDGIESSRTLRRNDLRLWSRLTLDRGAHELYLRARLSHLDFNTSDSYDGQDDDVEGPNLERGYYRFDLAKARGKRDDSATPLNVTITVGRDLVRLGGGLALAAPLDHVAIRATYGTTELTGLVGKSVGSTQDFDQSRSATRTRRNFLGIQLKSLAFDRHEPYVYALWQRDRNRERRHQPFQRYDYDSLYVGIGSSGEIIPRLRYEAEAVYETGNSFGSGQFYRENDISAWSVFAQIEYLFPGAHKTRASMEYLFASGDSDRIASPTNAASLNRGHFDDSSFVAFGYKDTGLSFAPRYSNLHMGRVGVSWYPWPDHARLKHLQVGSDWYLFYKHHRRAAVSDPTANVRSGYLGAEVDCFVNYQISADVSGTMRWGVFAPGQAFSDRSMRTFVLLGLTWSF